MPEKSHVALTKCFYCGEPDRLLLHRRLGDISEMHGKVIDHQPCPKCEGYMKAGVILISVRDGEEGDNPYRTGNFCVVREEAVRRFVTSPVLADSICLRRMAFVPDQAWARIGLPINTDSSS